MKRVPGSSSPATGGIRRTGIFAELENLLGQGCDTVGVSDLTQGFFMPRPARLLRQRRHFFCMQSPSVLLHIQPPLAEGSIALIDPGVPNAIFSARRVGEAQLPR